MDVRILYILNMGMAGYAADEESQKVCTGLFLKYRNRCEAAGVVYATAGQLAIHAGEQVKGILPLAAYQTPKEYEVRGHLPVGKIVEIPDSVDRARAAVVATRVAQDSSDNDRAVGLYVVMHGPGHLAPPAAYVATKINLLIPLALKPKLRYVVLLSCELADQGRNDQTISLDDAQRSYIIRFLMEMKARQMTPVVAGWDVVVTAAPHRPEGTFFNGGRRFNKSVTAFLKKSPGRKLIFPNHGTEQTPAKRFQFVPNEYRKLHKLLYRIDADGKLNVARGAWAEAQWRDKGKS
jgi:hypothetical protein